MSSNRFTKKPLGLVVGLVLLAPLLTQCDLISKLGAQQARVEDVQQRQGQPSLLDEAEFTQVKTVEWNQALDRIAQLEQQNELLRADTNVKVQAALMKSKNECLDYSREQRDKISDEVLTEVNSVIDGVKTRLSKYMRPAAVVNGRCKATLSNGLEFYYTLRNVCLNVVNKKVNNDGDVSGLIGAVSSEALQKGIAKLDCDVGEAHIALLEKKCDSIVSSSVAEVTDDPGLVSSMEQVRD